jgi:hypothetical protein
MLAAGSRIFDPRCVTNAATARLAVVAADSMPWVCAGSDSFAVGLTRLVIYSLMLDRFDNRLQP